MKLRSNDAIIRVNIDGETSALLPRRKQVTTPNKRLERIPKSVIPFACAKAEPVHAKQLTRNNWRFLASDFRALPTWANRFALLKEHLLPPPSYMLKKYGIRNRTILPLLYAYRAVKGIWKKLRH